MGRELAAILKYCTGGDRGNHHSHSYCSYFFHHGDLLTLIATSEIAESANAIIQHVQLLIQRQKATFKRSPQRVFFE